MMIRLPTTCWMIGVSGWKLNQSVTLSGWLPSAATASLQPAAGGLYGSWPRGALGEPLPSTLGSVMKIHPVFGGGNWADPTGLPPFGIGPLGHGLARFSVTAWAWTAAWTSAFFGQLCDEPLGSMKYEARTATRAPSLAACCSVM